MISIHAPVWGATIVDVDNVRVETISIHAPVWGARKFLSCYFCVLPYFNSRSRVGSDFLRFTIFCIYIYYFNSRSRVGSDNYRLYNE